MLTENVGGVTFHFTAVERRTIFWYLICLRY